MATARAKKNTKQRRKSNNGRALRGAESECGKNQRQKFRYLRESFKFFHSISEQESVLFLPFSLSKLSFVYLSIPSCTVHDTSCQSKPFSPPPVVGPSIYVLPSSYAKYFLWAAVLESWMLVNKLKHLRNWILLHYEDYLANWVVWSWCQSCSELFHFCKHF